VSLDFLLITGTRRESRELDRVLHDVCFYHGSRSTLLIVGANSSGADRLAAEIWKHLGFPVWKIPAPWLQFEKALGPERVRLAGPVRNAAMVGAARRMLGLGLTGKAVALPDAQSRGTRDCIRELEAAGIDVQVIEIGGGRAA
jgi:hypothetical protein